MGSLATSEIEAFLHKLGERYPHPVTLCLLGGSALCFLGNPRRTLDIDYTVSPLADNEALTDAIEVLAKEMRLEVESVPIEEFVPLPVGSEQRHRWLGQFGDVTVYLYDPYTIALSKLCRGFESDLQDVLFLLRERIINLDILTSFVEVAATQAWDFYIDPADLGRYFEEVKRQFL
ncbi:MAG: hypothetical protein KJ069_22950 [Anaerolineae bacterium]|nr:hypothetical protein [Anaerolineae bacterium]